MGNTDAYGRVSVQQLQAPIDFVTDTNGIQLADLRGRCNGTALIVLEMQEDASLATSIKLDVDVHNVASDSEAIAAGNLIESFTQIAGQNTTGTDLARTFVLEVPLEGLTKRYLQLNFTETGLFECILSVTAIFLGDTVLPQNA